MAPKSTFTHCKIPTGPRFESLGNSFLRGMLMACEIDEKLLPRPPQLRGDQLGNRAGYEARRRVTSGVVRGLSRLQTDISLGAKRPADLYMVIND